MDAYDGYVFQIIGDAYCVAFHSASDALNAAKPGMVTAVDPCADRDSHRTCTAQNNVLATEVSEDQSALSVTAASRGRGVNRASSGSLRSSPSAEAAAMAAT